MTGETLAQELGRLRGLRSSELIDRYRELAGREPQTRNRERLLRKVLWLHQERALGGLSIVAKRRLEELIAEIELPPREDSRTVTGRLRPEAQPKSTQAKPGMTLVKSFRGREWHASIRQDGSVEVDGVVHRSLTAAAKAITGTHWSGPLWWNLKPPKRKAQR